MNPPVEPWPDWLEGPDSLLAKGGGVSGTESLPFHTWQVLTRLAEHHRLRPDLHLRLGEPRLWHRLYWACFLHDFGKAASGFQAAIRHKSIRWPQRHEVLSLLYVDWLFPPDHTGDRMWVLALVASHHREANGLYAAYLDGTDASRQQLADLQAEINLETCTALWHWLDQCAAAWIDRLGLSEVVWPVGLPPLETALDMARRVDLSALLQEFDAFSEDLKWRDFDETARIGLACRGLMQSADHIASAQAARQSGPLQAFQLTRRAALGGLREADLHDHQRMAEQTPLCSALLIAPTGSGKTEAGLLWASRQAELSEPAPPRLFYVLPYQASMNAMYDRLLTRHFREGQVGLQHARALNMLYLDLLSNEDLTEEEAIALARGSLDLAELGVPPVRVLSPYQLLKSLYALKGYEARLIDVEGSLLIFDEIHAYEPRRLALIISMVGWLERHLACRALVMTATLPPPIHDALAEALPDSILFRASEAVFERSRRHVLHLLDGDLSSGAVLDRIAHEVAAGRSPLVCANTVGRAIMLYEELRQRLPDLDRQGRIILLHSRFNAQDRRVKEQRLLSMASVGVQRTQPVVAVATQVVEVSLDLNLDVLYTDPAPLEALLQRFGRVNRGQPAGSPLKPVYVCTQPDDGQHVYRADLVQAALRVLQGMEGQAVDEARVDELLASVYQGKLAEVWQHDYQDSADEFERVRLSRLQPFNSAEKWDVEAFYRLFDGIEVLPFSLEEEFQALIKARRYIEAYNLLVPLSYRRYAALERAGMAWREPRYKGDTLYLVDAPYDPDIGLDLHIDRHNAME
jgi:CRISPR-associated endonuclease/helicase Cas3